MSVYRRRYDGNEIIELMFNRSLREEEQKKFLLTLRDEIKEEDLITFFNFIALCSIDFYRTHTIDKDTCLKIIDKADGYLFGFEEGLIDKTNLYYKFKEIMEEDLYIKNWDYKVLYEVEDDYNKQK